MIGVVKWFNDDRGFGFITLPDGRQAFVHYSYLEQNGYKTLEIGDKVEFDLYEVAKYADFSEYEARNVRKAA